MKKKISIVWVDYFAMDPSANVLINAAIEKLYLEKIPILFNEVVGTGANHGETIDERLKNVTEAVANLEASREQILSNKEHHGQEVFPTILLLDQSRLGLFNTVKRLGVTYSSICKTGITASYMVSNDDCLVFYYRPFTPGQKLVPLSDVLKEPTSLNVALAELDKVEKKVFHIVIKPTQLLGIFPGVTEKIIGSFVSDHPKDSTIVSPQKTDNGAISCPEFYDLVKKATDHVIAPPIIFKIPDFNEAKEGIVGFLGGKVFKRDEAKKLAWIEIPSYKLDGFRGKLGIQTQKVPFSGSRPTDVNYDSNIIWLNNAIKVICDDNDDITIEKKALSTSYNVSFTFPLANADNIANQIDVLITKWKDLIKSNREETKSASASSSSSSSSSNCSATSSIR